MNLYQDFESLKRKDEELASHFLQQEMAVKWANAIIRDIAKWIAQERAKGYWEVVRYVSWKYGVFDKKLNRNAFAKMVYTFCKDALPQKETSDKIQSSMAQSAFVNELKKLKEEDFSAKLKYLIATIEAYLNESTIPDAPMAPTIKDRLEAYLRDTLVEDTEKKPFQRILINPDYGNDITPDIAIENYQNKTFLKSKKPSIIQAYVCIEGKLDKEKLRSIICQYEDKKNLKLFIVSTCSINNDVYSLAEKKSIGFVLIDPKKEMNQDSYILPRSIVDLTNTSIYTDMLLGRRKIEVPIIIRDEKGITTSLADSLESHGLVIHPRHKLRAPFLTNDEIESMADKLTEIHVDWWLEFIKKNKGNLFFQKKVPITKRQDGRPFVEMKTQRLFFDMSIDPFVIAEKQGLHYEVKEMKPGELGRIDLVSKIVTLNESEYSNYERFRFTMSHEVGHYLIHSPLINEKGIISFGDTPETITDSPIIVADERKRLEWQANHFAASLLMPQKMVTVLFVILHKLFAENIYGDQFGPIYYNPNQRETWDIYNNIVGGLSQIFNVSLQAMEIRLRQLNFLSYCE